MNRVVWLKVNRETARLDVTDRVALKELTLREKKAAKTGFDDDK